jgi:hypothetical protein
MVAVAEAVAALGAGPSGGGFDAMQVEVGCAKGEDNNKANELVRGVRHDKDKDDGSSDSNDDDIDVINARI